MNVWHFTARPGVLRDGTPIVLGETLRMDGEIVPCERGFHGSVSLHDAIRFAPGPYLYRVTLGGTIMAHSTDKHVASERTATAGGADASLLLRAFARSCALDVLHLWGAPKVVVQYLRTGDKSLAASAADDAAAWAANTNAASNAAYAAYAAAWAAADDASAAAAAATNAAYAASAADAWAADARDAQRVRLEAWGEAWFADGTVPDLTDYPTMEASRGRADRIAGAP